MMEDDEVEEQFDDEIELTDEAPEPTPLTPGFHVMLSGQSLGCYPTADDAEAFANAHPRAEGHSVTIEEITG